MVDLSYFTTTLGQAASLSEPNGVKPCSTITAFIDDQALRVPDRPAVGFVDPGNGHCHKPRHVLYTFQDLKQMSTYAAQRMAPLLDSPLQQSTALLSPSTPEFLFAWLGLIRLGRPVLLVAPQCPPAAITHLCHACGASILLFDSAYFSEAEEAAKTSKATGESSSTSSKAPLTIRPLPISVMSADFGILGDRNYPVCVEKQDAIAYYFHTSGTSSGLPKPIPQSHHGAIAVLPRLVEGCDKATFTTTPLYHGGISDCMRSWTSDAPIWLFWARNRPITASNVSKCLDYIQAAEPACPAIKYFSSVPYILQMMASDPKGLAHLQSMAIVGVGGAALPAKIGDALVAQNVNLVSRYGSAECGFLLSSHRDYAHDKAWQYLRASHGCESLTFEPYVAGDADEPDMAQLVVQRTWPHCAVANRGDGSFATADLLVPHPTLPHAWRYHARADAQLTLVTGKKFDPSVIEDALAASTPLLDDVVVFGVGRPFPGALLIRARSPEYCRDNKEEREMVTDADVIRIVAPVVERLNAKSQAHARIGRNMLIVLGPDVARPQKSSKGTLLRNQAYELYREYIDKAYALFQGNGAQGVPAAGESMAAFLRRKTSEILGRAEQPDVDADLFAYGVDSVASVQLRHFVMQLLGSETMSDVSMTVVEDMGTIARLCRYVEQQRSGTSCEDGEGTDRQIELMHQLVDKYGKFADQPVAGGPSQSGGNKEHKADRQEEVILLTGATGSLGAHVLSLYRASPTVSRIYCLVRGASPNSARERVHKALLARGLPGLGDNDEGTIENDMAHDRKRKVIILQSRLSAPDLGVSETVYSALRQQVTVIMHLAWAVNFRLNLQSFETDHIAGTAHLLRLALSSERAAKMAFCSSVASVVRYPVPQESMHAGVVLERISTDATHASPMGYGRSKWVAEALCVRAAAAVSSESSNTRVAIFRVGQLSGDLKYGVWNASEAWPLMLASAKTTKCLPRLEGVVLDWLPVDVAAAAIVEGTSSIGMESGADDQTHTEGKGSGVGVFHIVNNSPDATTWDEMLEWVQKGQGCRQSWEIVNPDEWLERLAQAQQNGVRCPAAALLPLWRAAYGNVKPEDPSINDGVTRAGLDGRDFDSRKALQIAPILISRVGKVRQDHFLKLMGWIEKAIE